jgi:glycosyltransferase involved in cell wall biosynthesis
MKIAYVYDAVYPYVKGGGERRIYEVANRLSRRGHEIHIFGAKYWEGARSFRNNGIYYHGLGKAAPLYHSSGRRSISQALSFGLRAWRMLTEMRFDVIDCGQWPYFHLLPAKVYSVMRRSHFVVTWYEVWKHHWLEYMGKAGLAGLLVEKTFCHLPEKIAAVSELTRQDLMDIGVPADRVVVIPNGIDYHRIRSLPAGSIRTHLAYCGRLKNHKNVDVMVQAVALMKRNMSDVSAVIIGSGPEEQRLKEMARSLHAEKNIIFTGAIEDFDDVVKWLKSSLIFVNPSTKEGGGSITLFEANACGLPTIAVRCENGIDPSLIHHGENGYFVDTLSPELIANLGLELLRDQKRLSRSSEASVGMASAYDWDEIASQYERLYLQLSPEPQ